MGSEWVIIGYGMMAFLSLCLFGILMISTKWKGSQEDSLDKKIDPVTIFLMLLSLAIFVFSMIGMSKGVIESYDYCSIVPENMTESGATTTVDYTRVCFTNTYSEDENIYEMTYFIMWAFVVVFIIGAVWQLFLFIKNQLWITLRNKFFRRK